MPIQRNKPVYVQIAEDFRKKIRDGEMRPGQPLPSITELANELGVSRSTVAQAYNRLQVERAISTSTQGTVVSSDGIVTRIPGDRLRTAILETNESIEVTAAERKRAPDYVASLLNLEPGSEVIRREEITTIDGQRRMLSVDWAAPSPTQFVEEALNPNPLPGGIEGLLRSTTNRKVTHTEDFVRARGADTREASALQVPVGAPILAGAHVWTDADGVIAYGEWVIPENHDISFAADIAYPEP